MDEPYIARVPWGYVLSWDGPVDMRSFIRAREYVVVTRCYTTKALFCHHCDKPGRDPCEHISQVVAFVHRKQGA